MLKIDSITSHLLVTRPPFVNEGHRISHYWAGVI
jgi:hypothetical protein